MNKSSCCNFSIQHIRKDGKWSAVCVNCGQPCRVIKITRRELINKKKKLF